MGLHLQGKNLIITIENTCWESAIDRIKCIVELQKKSSSAAYIGRNKGREVSLKHTLKT
jgi:hypothetical protein